jgi:hypothetical protein
VWQVGFSAAHLKNMAKSFIVLVSMGNRDSGLE